MKGFRALAQMSLGNLLGADKYAESIYCTAIQRCEKLSLISILSLSHVQVNTNCECETNMDFELLSTNAMLIMLFSQLPSVASLL